MKRLNRKGFTLIELLAIIVILAVLITLASPAVLNIMDNSRKNSFVIEAKTFKEAADMYFSEYTMNNAGDPVPTCVSFQQLVDDKYLDAKEHYKGTVTETAGTVVVVLTNGTYNITIGTGSVTMDNVAKKDVKDGDITVAACPTPTP